MKDKAQLKQEIESYKESMKGLEPHSDFRRGQLTAYNQIMQFIDSIPEEPTKEDLEEEIKNYFSTWLIDLNNHKEFLLQFARHFAEWGRNHFEDKSEMVSEDLEKVAGKYAENHGFRVPYDGSNKFYDDVDVKASKEGFIAGAEWQRKKDQETIELAEDHAMQDFLEKAERFFNEELFTRFSGGEYRVASNKCMNLQQFIKQFKKYMEDEN